MICSIVNLNSKLNGAEEEMMSNDVKALGRWAVREQFVSAAYL